jgi:prepilin-type N-terminal cleavage/methylation domain-containing protein
MLINRNGFTLIELLVVVVVIGVLATIAIPAFEGSRDRAHAAALQTDLTHLTKFMEGFLQDNAAEPYTYEGAAGDPSGPPLNLTLSPGVSIEVVTGITPESGPFYTAIADHTATDRGCAYDSRGGGIHCVESGGGAGALLAISTP